MKYENYENIIFDRSAGVLTVTLNRPEARNATDERLHKELSRVFADIAQDKETRAVILTGSGSAFCAGGDLKHGLNMNRDQTDAMVEEGRKIIMDILEVPQPVIAAVNGYAMGLGATLALFCDIVVASEEAVFADTHVVAGYVAGDGGAPPTLPRGSGAARLHGSFVPRNRDRAQDPDRNGHVAAPPCPDSAPRLRFEALSERGPR